MPTEQTRAPSDGRDDPLRRLDGRVAVVTGAGRGLGRAIALDLAARGAWVVVNDTGGSFRGDGADAGVADEVVGEIEERGGRACSNHDSVASMDGGRRIIRSALEAFGRVDVLVNNAGVTRQNMLWDLDEADWDSVIATHLKGNFACMKAAMPVMMEQRAGSIVNMSSGVSVVGSVGTANYCAAKAGIIGLTFAAAMELGPFGIRVNVVFPAGHSRLHTKTEPWRDRYRVQERPAMPADRWPAEAVAPLIAFLASDAATHVNGQLFTSGGESTGCYGTWQVEREVATPVDASREHIDEQLERLVDGLVNPSPEQSGEIVWPWIRPGALPAAHDPTR